ncbi:GNAT family N-acetyltransferase [Aequorivita echinoideorum]|uniref:GNAT family N-acetyltransferase n=1 Tax=Aequorivita echinoideorum TaxID=1549647 RepID=A0ABS5S1C0_9FLAO|nr:GNAT family N-acetyltransferase [Aequorivita echinoideorum]MBT0607009.1 GNAT family N-acetyltransferase [Aequorivita echinoideorum]
MKLKIRSATPEDYLSVAPLMVQAMNSLACSFANSENMEDAVPLFKHFFQKKQNQYSYENTLVAEISNSIVGSITGYDGALLLKYRKPFLEYISENYGVQNLILEEETVAGEYYIDTLSVAGAFQNRGIGGHLVRHFIEKASNESFEKVGLLVETENIRAEKLYLSLGFQCAGEKRLAGTIYKHLQISF